MKWTRRQWAAVISASAMAQAKTGEQAAASADDLQAARGRLKASADALAQQKVAMDTEPAFQFKA